MTRKLRLVTGIVLFLFVTGHLINLAFGLISIELLDELKPVFLAPWHNPIGEPLLIFSMLVHGLLGLLALYHRNTLHMTKLDASQLLLGLAIPPLLISHLLGTAIGEEIAGAQASYASVLTFFWVVAPISGLEQVLVLIATWIHGCMGLFVWMRLQSWWPRIAGFAYPLVVLIPVLALLGMVEAGKEAIALQGDSAFMAKVAEGIDPLTNMAAELMAIERNVLIGYGTMILVVLVARAVRLRAQRGLVTLTYVDGPEVRVKAGPTLLEISRMNDVPHAGLCGGRGRCGTCRVRIKAGLDSLPQVASIEAATLEQIGAEPEVRLACQAAPVGGQSLEIERLLPAYTEPEDLHAKKASMPAPLSVGGVQ
ncbi:MAG: 2Fe-2S iron-sulfur cluster-binding protein [Pseudomonadota bacterium]